MKSIFISMVLLVGVFVDKAQAFEADCRRVVSPVEDAICRSHINEAEQQVTLAYRAYEDILAVVSPDLKLLLVREQKSWEDYRDAYCRLEGQSHGFGTMGTGTMIACMADMNRERSQSLKERAQLWK
ncbi:MAG TPA: DUF1311 domain-containing protein [Alphaproteobacteria bacterium]|nr:DUF1311 domain-containing protein [Alphaproteobacteria bacterium]